MKRFFVLVALTCATALLFTRAWTLAQQISGAIKVEVHLVEVYATVYDHKGGYIDGLARESFEVFDNGQPESITHFETSGQGLSCGILLDTTRSMADVLPSVKNSIVKLIDALEMDDSVAIYTFDTRLTVRQGFTSDKMAAKRAILRTRAEGQTALFDALSGAAEDISRRAGKKALIVFTDGDDNASALTANASAAVARRLGIPLYAIAEGEAMRAPKLRKTLKELSERTGGAAYSVQKPADIEDVFRKIAENLKHLYLIAYQPPTRAGDTQWHKIEVSLRGLNPARDYRIRARQGYFPD